jgi:transposase
VELPCDSARISKAGSVRDRSLLVEAAWPLLRWKAERTKASWARIAQRRGKPTAVVALARKLAGIMFAVWRDGTQFDPQLLRPLGAPATT